MTHLNYVIIQVFGVPVDQVYLLGVDVLHGLLVDTVVVHAFVVRFVNVALLPDERRVNVFLRIRKKSTKWRKSFQ